MKRAGLWGLCALISAGPVWAAEANSFLLQNVHVHPVVGPELPNGAVLVRDGKIAEVGAKLASRGVPVIEGRGKHWHVYPGMIDSATEMGLSEIRSVRETNDINELGDFNPQLRALVSVNPSSEHIPVTRVNGITSVLTMPSGGVIAGQAALVRLDGWTWEEMAIRPQPAMVLNYPVIQTQTFSFTEGRTRRPFAEAKKTHDDQITKLHEFLETVRRYQKAKAARSSGFQADLRLEAMLPVIEGKLPLMVVAVRERAVREALEFADKEKVRIILAGVREPGKMLADLKAKKIPVILGPTLELPLSEDDPYDAAATLPAQLLQAGVPFAFGTFSVSFSRNLPYQAAHAAAFGLSAEEALKAVTIRPAEIWGIADQVGSIEPGKLADLVVTDGDLLEATTHVQKLFLKGKEVGLENRHLQLYEKYRKRS